MLTEKGILMVLQVNGLKVEDQGMLQDPKHIFFVFLFKAINAAEILISVCSLDILGLVSLL